MSLTFSQSGRKVGGSAAQLVRRMIERTTTPEAVAALEGGAVATAPDVVASAAGVTPPVRPPLGSSVGLGSGGGGNIPSKLSGLMKGPWGPILAIMAAQFFGEQVIGKHHGLASTDIEKEGLEAKSRAMDPQAAYYEALLPQLAQQEEMSRVALMQTMMGGGQPLAKGQEMFGGV